MDQNRGFWSDLGHDALHIGEDIGEHVIEDAGEHIIEDGVGDLIGDLL